MPMQFQEFDVCYVERLRAGDINIEEHFCSYFGELIRLKTRKRLKSADDIDDVRQETFARVLQVLRGKSIDHPERLGAFVNSVCNHVLSERYRSSRREVRVEDEFDVADPAPSATDRVELRQMKQKIRQILAQLPVRDCRLIQAVFLEERDKDEVCRDFGVDREYLRVLLYRAKLAFKAHYLKSMGLERDSSSVQMRVVRAAAKPVDRGALEAV